MKRSLIIIAVGAAVALGLAACGSSSKNSAGSSASPTTAASASGGYSYGASTPTTAASTPTTAASTASAALGVAMSAKVHQNIVVDSAGKTVYIYMPDGMSTTSKVPAALKAAWPAVTSMSSSPAVGSGLTGKATVNSAHQVAYNGHLLYTFQADTKPGTANGQGLGNVWYVISPSGTPIS